jgi:drug/metabolite transporter (DMT)-like permease
MTRFKADLLLLLCAFIWGTAFVAQKDLHAAHWPLLFVAARFALSALLLAPLALWEARRAQAPPLRGADLGLGGLIGLCLCTGATLQQWALTGTTATNGGFLTAVYVAFVPFVVWAVAGTRPRPLVLLACAVAVLGAWLLAGGKSGGWSRGDLVLLASDLVWALHITLIARFLGAANRPFLLCLIQYAVTAAGAGLVGALGERPQWADFAAGLPAIAYAGVASGGIAYTLQIVAQRHAPAAEAALILSLESVFAALAGALLLHERLGLVASLGCLLILAGAVMVDLAPAVRRGLLRVAGRGARATPRP